MVPNLSRKLFAIVALLGLTIWSGFQFSINLGLDLQGGSRIVYRLPIEEAIAAGDLDDREDPQQLRRDIIEIFQRRLDGSGLLDVGIFPQAEESIAIELPGRTAEEVEMIKESLRNQGTLQFRILAEPADDIGFQEEIDKFRAWRTANPDGTVRDFNRLSEGEGGTRAGVLWVPIAQELLDDKPEEANGLRHVQAQDLDAVLVRDEDVLRGIAPGDSASWNFDGAQLRYVGPGADRYGRPAVRFEFAENRRAAFEDFTEEFTNRGMGIVLSGELHTAPNINQPLPGGGIIEGGRTGFSQDEMRSLINVLRTGSLKIVPELESSYTVGPGLGKDSIRIGIWSAAIGGILVLLFMLGYYRVNGMVACLALLFNAVILFGALSFTQATLTLPGLAGLVLTIGMAVDANILIFERVREERKRGRETPQAYKNGYERAFTTIVDANLTTLITGGILFYVGTGPVQGFAAVLSLGILTSMFSALVFSKVLMHFLVFGKGSKVKEVSMVKAVAENAHVAFLAKAKGALSVSCLLIVGGLVIWGTRIDTMLGPDFTGGCVARVKLEQATDIADLRASMDVYGVQSAGDNSDEFLFKLARGDARDADGNTVSDLATYVKDDVRSRIGPQLWTGGDPFLGVNVIGERVSGEMQQKAIQAILLSLIAVVIYMNFRFKEYRFGIAAVVALFHDVLFTMGALALFDMLGLVQVEISLEIVAAFLTIIGYSLNDTIVVFDRIRENLPRRKGTFQEIIDLSINQSLSRTILTSVTTFLVLAILFVANRPQHNVLEGFSFAMLVGVVIGTYSSMFVASPMLVFLDRWARNRRVDEGAEKGGKATTEKVVPAKS